MKRTMVILAVVVLVASACSAGNSDTTDAPGNTTTSSTDGSAPADTTTTAGAAEEGGSASLGEPCSYVSDAEMSELLGKNVVSEASGDLLCLYAPGDGSGGIELLIQDVSDVGCELVFSVGGFEGEEAVDGVGTYAMYKTATTPQMAVCFDEQVTLVATMYAEPTNPKEVLISVATSVEQGLT